MFTLSLFEKENMYLFSDTCVLLCDFHREQAWQRWLGAKKNGVSQEKDTIIKQ